MVYLVMHLATRIWIRIVNLLALSGNTTACERRSRGQKPRSAPAQDAELDDEWMGPWIRQQQRVRDAIARAKPKSAPVKDAEMDDEWVGPWIRQQQRVRDAIAEAKRRSSAAKG